MPLGSLMLNHFCAWRDPDEVHLIHLVEVASIVELQLNPFQL
jgi:hypothetical protein